MACIYESQNPHTKINVIQHGVIKTHTELKFSIDYEGEHIVMYRLKDTPAVRKFLMSIPKMISLLKTLGYSIKSFRDDPHADLNDQKNFVDGICDEVEDIEALVGEIKFEEAEEVL